MSIPPISGHTATHRKSASTRSASTLRSCVRHYGVSLNSSWFTDFFLTLYSTAIRIFLNESSINAFISLQIHIIIYTLFLHCLFAVGVNLLVGTENGLMLLDRSGQGKVYNLINRRRFQQMEVLEGLNVLVTISGEIIISSLVVCTKICFMLVLLDLCIICL